MTMGLHARVDSINNVLRLVMMERLAQEERYGHVNDNHPLGTGPETRWLLPYTGSSAVQVEQILRADYEDFQEETGGITWLHLIREEFAEVAMEGDLEKLKVELIQLAALAVSAVERIESGDHA